MYSVLGFLFLAYVSAIAFYSPQKQSLRNTQKTTIFSRMFRSKCTLILGCLLILLAFITFNPATGQILPLFAGFFGYSKQGFFDAHLYFQPLSSVFLHFNVIHLTANLSALLWVSAYERRVGLFRYLTVFLVAGVAAALLDILFIPQGVISLGASGGISGLAAGFALDHTEEVPTAEWLKNSALVVLLILILSFLPQNGTTQLNVNWIDHILGAICAAVFVRAFRITKPADIPEAAISQPDVV